MYSTPKCQSQEWAAMVDNSMATLMDRDTER
jgi:hypothetical protein